MHADDYVETDLPTLVAYVLHASGAPAVHIMAHSMGGMILTRALAAHAGDGPNGLAAKIASATVIGSGCFLKGALCVVVGAWSPRACVRACAAHHHCGRPPAAVALRCDVGAELFM